LGGKIKKRKRGKKRGKGKRFSRLPSKEKKRKTLSTWKGGGKEKERKGQKTKEKRKKGGTFCPSREGKGKKGAAGTFQRHDQREKGGRRKKRT